LYWLVSSSEDELPYDPINRLCLGQMPSFRSSRDHEHVIFQGTNNLLNQIATYDFSLDYIQVARN
jgi:hypothetical protein